LKELTININSNISQSSSFAQVKLPMLIKLELIASHQDSDSIAMKLSENFPLLRHLKLINISANLILQLLQNQNLVSLDTGTIFTQPEDIVISWNSVTSSTCQKSLKELSIGRVDKQSRNVQQIFFSLITENLRNLEKLKLNDNLISNVQMLKLVLKSQRRLKFISIASTMQLDEHFKKCLKIYGRNLKYIEIRGYAGIGQLTLHKINSDLQRNRSVDFRSFQQQFSHIDQSFNSCVMKNVDW